MKIHIVQKGDTLWSIAEQYGVEFEQLKEENPQIASPEMIMPGMKIKIPQVQTEKHSKNEKEQEKIQVEKNKKNITNKKKKKEKKANDYNKNKINQKEKTQQKEKTNSSLKKKPFFTGEQEKGQFNQHKYKTYPYFQQETPNSFYNQNYFQPYSYQQEPIIQYVPIYMYPPTYPHCSCQRQEPFHLQRNNGMHQNLKFINDKQTNHSTIYNRNQKEQTYQTPLQPPSNISRSSVFTNEKNDERGNEQKQESISEKSEDELATDKIYDFTHQRVSRFEDIQHINDKKD